MTAATISFRPRIVPLLSCIAAVLIISYVVLMVTAIIFASFQTQLARDVQQKRMDIAKLESTYYASVTELDQTDPHALGYVSPQRVKYVAAADIPTNLTFAHN